MAISMLAGMSRDFVAPAEGPVPFRRDRIALDAETIAGLSARLTLLADGMYGTNALEKRRAAQMLALSLALDPMNREARTLIREFESGQHQAETNAVETRDALEWMLRLREWLASDSAGVDGKSLAVCLNDVLVDSNLDEKGMEGKIVTAEIGAWQGWVADLSQFETPVETAPEIVSEDALDSEVGLETASVSVPLWKPFGTAIPPQWRLELSKLTMTRVKVLDETLKNQPFSVVIGNSAENRFQSAEMIPLLELLKRKHGELPKGVVVRIECPDFEVSAAKSKDQVFSAAAAVLASAAITGIAPEGIIIGAVDSMGKLSLPKDYWQQLRALSSRNAPRLILPEEAATDMPSLLVMGEIGFFMEHEILLAKDFDELLALATQEPAEEIQRTLTDFETIRKRGNGLSPGPYVAKVSVRKALSDLAQAAPYHESARMLAIQGAGGRPSYITRRVLFAELRRALEPMDWLVKHGQAVFSPADQAKIGTTFETCRSAVEQLLRYAEKADHGPLEQALSMLTTVRSMDRASRVKVEDDGLGSSRALDSYAAFFAAHKEFMVKLNTASADVGE